MIALKSPISEELLKTDFETSNNIELKVNFQSNEVSLPQEQGVFQFLV